MSGIAIGPTILSAVAGKIVGDIFSDDPAGDDLHRRVYPPPEVEDPPVMPISDDKAAATARRRSIAKSMSRRGRQSTILTDPVTGGDAGDALGG